MQERPTTRLRRLIAQPGCVMAPGAADAFTARMIARAGFQAIHMTGFGTSIGRLGMPDIGLLAADEMIDNASRIAVDADAAASAPKSPYRRDFAAST